MERRRLLVDHMKRFPTLAGLLGSAFYVEHGVEIESFLATPERVSHSGSAPRLSAFIRVAQWNLEKGKRFDEALILFETDPVLRWADIIILNEADHGMARSGNRHVALDLARALGMNMAFGAACLELTNGVGEDLAVEGENRESLQGNAVLSRYPVLEARTARLPQCFEPYEFGEKRYGGRNCVWARLQVGSGTLWVGSTHLEVRNTPECRAHQIRHLISTLPAETGEPCLFGGDFNANTFRRGTLWRTLSGAARLIWSDPEAMKDGLLHPERTEPLFRVVAQSGFSPRGLNSPEATAIAELEDLEDTQGVPRILKRYIQQRLAPYQGRLCLKLDWLMGKGIQALGQGEIKDPGTGVTSRTPGCLLTEREGRARISDHSPIFADLNLPRL